MNWYKELKAKSEKKCAFIAALMPKSFYKKYSHIEDLGDDLHMTILYIEDFEDQDGDRDKILKAVKRVASKYYPIKCKTTALGVMGNDSKTFVVNMNVENGAEFYSDLVKEVEKEWHEFEREYDFLPHVSLNYQKGEKEFSSEEFKDFSWTIDKIAVSFNHDDSTREWVELKGEKSG